MMLFVALLGALQPSLEQQLMRSPQLVAALRRGAAAAGDPSRLELLSS